MRTLAILPIKSFNHAKQRLEPELNPGPRRALAEAMFSDVLVALRRAAAVDEMLVVTTDHAAQQIAGGHGAAVLDDVETGHNAAAALGVAHAIEAGFERALLVPGDCPAVDPAEVDALIRHTVTAPSVLIIPDRHGTGTNGLLLTPPDALTPAFGPGSCARHATNARAAGIAAEVWKCLPWVMTSTHPRTWPRCRICSPPGTAARLTRAECSTSCCAAGGR